MTKVFRPAVLGRTGSQRAALADIPGVTEGEDGVFRGKLDVSGEMSYVSMHEMISHSGRGYGGRLVIESVAYYEPITQYLLSAEGRYLVPEGCNDVGARLTLEEMGLDPVEGQSWMHLTLAGRLQAFADKYKLTKATDVPSSHSGGEMINLVDSASEGELNGDHPAVADGVDFEYRENPRGKGAHPPFLAQLLDRRTGEYLPVEKVTEKILASLPPERIKRYCDSNADVLEQKAQVAHAVMEDNSVSPEDPEAFQEHAAKQEKAGKEYILQKSRIRELQRLRVDVLLRASKGGPKSAPVPPVKRQADVGSVVAKSGSDAKSSNSSVSKKKKGKLNVFSLKNPEGDAYLPGEAPLIVLVSLSEEDLESYYLQCIPMVENSIKEAEATGRAPPDESMTKPEDLRAYQQHQKGSLEEAERLKKVLAKLHDALADFRKRTGRKVSLEAQNGVKEGPDGKVVSMDVGPGGVGAVANVASLGNGVSSSAKAECQNPRRADLQNEITACQASIDALLSDIDDMQGKLSGASSAEAERLVEALKPKRNQLMVQKNEMSQLCARQDRLQKKELQSAAVGISDSIATGTKTPHGVGGVASILSGGVGTTPSLPVAPTPKALFSRASSNDPRRKLADAAALNPAPAVASATKGLREEKSNGAPGAATGAATSTVEAMDVDSAETQDASTKNGEDSMEIDPIEDPTVRGGVADGGGSVALTTVEHLLGDSTPEAVRELESSDLSGSAADIGPNDKHFGIDASLVIPESCIVPWDGRSPCGEAALKVWGATGYCVYSDRIVHKGYAMCYSDGKAVTRQTVGLALLERDPRNKLPIRGTDGKIQASPVADNRWVLQGDGVEWCTLEDVPKMADVPGMIGYERRTGLLVDHHLRVLVGHPNLDKEAQSSDQTPCAKDIPLTIDNCCLGVAGSGKPFMWGRITLFTDVTQRITTFPKEDVYQHDGCRDGVLVCSEVSHVCRTAQGSHWMFKYGALLVNCLGHGVTAEDVGLDVAKDITEGVCAKIADGIGERRARATWPKGWEAGTRADELHQKMYDQLFSTTGELAEAFQSGMCPAQVFDYLYLEAFTRKDRNRTPSKTRMSVAEIFERQKREAEARRLAAEATRKQKEEEARKQKEEEARKQKEEEKRKQQARKKPEAAKKAEEEGQEQKPPAKPSNEQGEGATGPSSNPVVSNLAADPEAVVVEEFFHEPKILVNVRVANEEVQEQLANLCNTPSTNRSKTLASELPSPRFELKVAEEGTDPFVDEGYITTLHIPRKILVECMRWFKTTALDSFPVEDTEEGADKFLKMFTVPISEMDWRTLAFFEMAGGSVVDTFYGAEIKKRADVLTQALRDLDLSPTKNGQSGHVCGLAHPRIVCRETGFGYDSSKLVDCSRLGPSNLASTQAEMYRRDANIMRAVRAQGDGLKASQAKRLYGIHCKTLPEERNLECTPHRLVKDAFDLTQEGSAFAHERFSPGPTLDMFRIILDVCGANTSLTEHLLRLETARQNDESPLRVHDTLSAMTTRVAHEYTEFRPLVNPAFGYRSVGPAGFKAQAEPMARLEPLSRETMFEELVESVRSQTRCKTSFPFLELKRGATAKRGSETQDAVDGEESAKRRRTG